MGPTPSRLASLSEGETGTHKKPSDVRGPSAGVEGGAGEPREGTRGKTGRARRDGDVGSRREDWVRGPQDYDMRAWRKDRVRAPEEGQGEGTPGGPREDRVRARRDDWVRGGRRSGEGGMTG